MAAENVQDRGATTPLGRRCNSRAYERSGRGTGEGAANSGGSTRASRFASEQIARNRLISFANGGLRRGNGYVSRPLFLAVAAPYRSFQPARTAPGPGRIANIRRLLQPVR